MACFANGHCREIRQTGCSGGMNQQNQGWRFLNFYYPSEKTNLLKQLQQLKQARAKH